MIIELVAVATLIIALLSWTKGRLPWLGWTGIGFLLVLPLLQLMPLPPAVWMALPGREVAADIGRFVDPTMWQPLSMDPNATLKTWLSLFAPIALFLTTALLSYGDRLLLVRTFLAVAALSVLLGLLQITLRSDWLYLFPSASNKLPLGLFTNRNHQAAMLYVAVALSLFLALRREPRPTIERMVCAGLVVLFMAGIFATQSRSGMALMTLTLALGGLMFLLERISWRPVALAGLAVIAGVWLLSQSGVVRSALTRFFADTSDGRYEFWPEVRYAADVYYPAGSGLGTFVSAYQGVEQLSTVSPYYLNHAHNEYLQLLVEGGVLGTIGLVLFAIFLFSRTWRILFREPLDDPNRLARIAVIAIAALLLHSIADYPIRTYALMTLFGMLCGLLYRPGLASGEPTLAELGNDRGGHGSAVRPIVTLHHVSSFPAATRSAMAKGNAK